MGKRISSREFAGAWIRIAGAETRRWRPAGEKGWRLVAGRRADAEARRRWPASGGGGSSPGGDAARGG